MKIEMAVLYSTGGGEGQWELEIVEIPDIYKGRPYPLIDQIGRQAIMNDPTFEDSAGCYCFNEMYE